MLVDWRRDSLFARFFFLSMCIADNQHTPDRLLLWPMVPSGMEMMSEIDAVMFTALVSILWTRTSVFTVVCDMCSPTFGTTRRNFLF